MNYSFDDANAAERHDLQYFEMFVNRGVYHQGWTAVTRHSLPWDLAAGVPYDEDVWAAFDVTVSSAPLPSSPRRASSSVGSVTRRNCGP